MRKIRLFGGVFCAICVLFVWTVQHVAAQPFPVTAVCDDVRYFMTREITPFDMEVGGGVLQPQMPQDHTLDAGSWGDIWAFKVTLPRDNFNNSQDTVITFSFLTVDSSLSADVALFNGLGFISSVGTSDIYELASTGNTYQFLLKDDGIYTFVIRRNRLSDSANVGRYQFQADFPGGGTFEPKEIRNNTTNQVFSGARNLSGGIETLKMTTDDVLVRAHAGSIEGVGTPGTSTKLYFGSTSQYDMLIGNWAGKIDLLGGDFAVSGTVNNQPRIFYLENFGYQTKLDSETLTHLKDSNGSSVTTDWSQVVGLWVVNECTGIKFADGTTFVAATPSTNRSVDFGEFSNDACEAYAITINAVSPTASASSYSLCMTRSGLFNTPPYAETTLNQGIFTLYLDVPFTGNTGVTDPDVRGLRLQTTHLSLFRREDKGVTESPFYWSIGMDDAVEAVIDWKNLKNFEYADDNNGSKVITLLFLDAPRGSTQRDGTKLSRFEALDDVIRIIYKDQAKDAGRQTLMLPASDSYIELDTPSGEPVFIPTALPGEVGYFPRGQNNRGGECYPVNTLLEQANCASNGQINPANGNLWYGVTDYMAKGYLLDLTLSRSYNSFDAAMDGPFGIGWSTNFMPDYNVPYNPASSSRKADWSVSDFYRTALDLTWAPRGIVVFETPSGSRHQFVGNTSRFESGVLTALTMPGWTLSRTSVRSVWQLTQAEGLTYEFDRAGRLVSYGYPAYNRVVQIAYPRTALNGPGNLFGQPVFLTDVINGTPLRRIEIYFYDHGHIALSVLRDLTTIEGTSIDQRISGLTGVPSLSEIACSEDVNCFATAYFYDTALGANGNPVYRLTKVDYPDGLQALYQYDDRNRLIWHDDPRAPVAQTMHYQYDQNSDSVTAVEILPAGTSDTALAQPWRELTAEQDENQRQVTVLTYPSTITGKPNPDVASKRVLTYDLTNGSLRAAEQTFSLLRQTNPLDGTSTTDPMVLPEEYGWAKGLLDTINQRVLSGGGGRNKTFLGYGDNGLFTTMNISGYPDFVMNAAAQSTQLRFSDGTSIGFNNLDSHGLPSERVDRFGAVYTYQWDDRGWLLQVSNTEERFEFTYNAVGLVLSVTRYGLQAQTPDSGYITMYSYDGLGRLTDISSGDRDVIYTVTYSRESSSEANHSNCDRSESPIRFSAVQDIRVVDTLGVPTLYRFDSRGQIVETIVGDQDAFLRCSTYEYDEWGRLSTEYKWLKDNTNQDALTVQYQYDDAVVELPSMPGDENTAAIVVRGSRVTQRDMYGRTRSRVYDALGRIREDVNIFGHITRYDYAAYRDLKNGFQITQRDYVQNQLTATTVYLFNNQWQLENIQRIVPASDTSPEQQFGWDVVPGADNVNLRDFTSSNILSAGFSASSAPPVLPGNVTLNIRDPLTGGASTVDPSLSVGYDSFGRMIQLGQDANQSDTQPDQVTQVAYCALENGRRQVRRSLPNAGTFDCQSANVASAITYDAYNRIMLEQDEFGSREFDYAVEGDYWLVEERIFTQAGGITWKLYYDTLGNLISWTNENGVTRTYQYDTLGRLISTVTGGQGENSPGNYRFTYNEADLLTRVEDGLGRGFSYDYNRFGQVTVEQNLITSDATTYVYDGSGLLTSVISNTGGTTTYQYNDPVDRTRLTGITLPSGAQESFAWDDDAQRIIHTDALNRQTTYYVDMTGQLRGITDALGQRHQFIYDKSGNLIDIQLLAASGNGALQDFLLQYQYPAIRVGEKSTSSWSWNFDVTDSGLLTSASPPGGQSGITFTYDAAGRIASINAGENRSWTITRSNGQILVDSPFGTQTLNFDPLYEITREDQTEFTYNAASIEKNNSGSEARLRVKVTSADGSAKIYEIASGNGRANILPHITVFAPGQYTVYTYAADGLLTEIQHTTCMTPGSYEIPDLSNLDEIGTLCNKPLPDGKEEPVVWRTSERFVYNESRLLIRAIDSEQNIDAFTYDAIGNLITYQNKNGETFSYRYDALNRLQELTGPTGIRLLFGYNLYNRLVGICQLHVELLLNFQSAATYDDCVSQTNGGNTLLAYNTYNQLGFPAEMVYGTNGGKIGFSYRGENQFNGWTADGRSTILDYGADSLGLLSSINTDSDTYSLSYQSPGLLRDDPVGTFDVGRLNLDGSVACQWTPNDNGDYVSYSIPAADGILKYIVGQNNAVYGILWEGGDDGGIAISYGQSENEERQINLKSCNPGLSTTLSPNSEDQSLQLIQRINVGNNQSIRLTLNYEITPLGQRRREVFDSISTNLFVQVPDAETATDGATDGYVVINTFDARGFPLATRVSADGEKNQKVDGKLLYIATSAYDTNGQIERETLQYGDGTQVNIDYRYAGVNQLVERIITFTSSSQANGLVGILMVGSVLPVWVLRRRKYGLSRLIGVLLLLVGSGVVMGQERPTATYDFSYRYDTAGNLVQSILNGEVACTTQYGYDAANRLISVKSPTGNASYVYDVYNRVTVLNGQKVSYESGNVVPFAVGDNHVFVRTPSGQTVFEVNDGGIEWSLNDGGAYNFANVSQRNQPQALSLIDPLERSIKLEDSPKSDKNGCLYLFSIPDTLSGQPIAGGIADTQGQVYLINGRAYLPELGRFLQRDPQGPDAFGNFYTLPTPSSRPPGNKKAGTLARGFELLGNAIALSQRTPQLEAQAVQNRFAPTPDGYNISDLGRQMIASGMSMRAYLGQYLSTAYWIPHGYNLSGVQMDALTGQLRLRQLNAPGLETSSPPDLLNLKDRVWGDPLWTPDSVPSSLNLFTNLVSGEQTPIWRVISYVPDRWEKSDVGLSMIGQIPAPQLDEMDAPGRLWAYIPHSLALTSSTFETLRLVQSIPQLVNQSGADFIEERLDASLPATLPQLPQKASDWLGLLFSNDVIGTANMPGMFWALPPTSRDTFEGEITQSDRGGAPQQDIQSLFTPGQLTGELGQQ